MQRRPPRLAAPSSHRDACFDETRCGSAGKSALPELAALKVAVRRGVLRSFERRKLLIYLLNLDYITGLSSASRPPGRLSLVTLVLAPASQRRGLFFRPHRLAASSPKSEACFGETRCEMMRRHQGPDRGGADDQISRSQARLFILAGEYHLRAPLPHRRRHDCSASGVVSLASRPAQSAAPLESRSVTRLLDQLGKLAASTQNIPMTLRIDPGLRRLGLFLQPRSIAGLVIRQPLVHALPGNVLGRFL
jgi:hypothetical protein